METGNGGCSGGVSLRSHDSNGSSASMRMRRKTHEEACFCKLKAVIKKFGTVENPNRLFYACPRYRKGSHCNYFNWVGDDDYEVVVEVQVESEYDEWRVKVAWRLGSLEGEVRSLKLLIIFMFVIVVINVILCCLIRTSK
ncbi:hypothetical protein Ahy_B04g070118 isoform A [Arachis hypogaea]|uniref:GRF-type domain-containing protein n=1 Tax=Arachis hypogaea TaxID=3818 RepID=A0A444ZEX4_ARAHY|nr:hypothetical protein Ahy_B04g070118 isoform A [Arachis hypogaea]